MGIVKLRDTIIYEGPLAEVVTDLNWNNSMAEYYPILVLKFMVGDKIENKRIYNTVSYSDIQFLSIEVDTDQERHMYSILDRQRKLDEFNRIDYHKLVKVFKGRKVPIGTVGEVHWMGKTRYGDAVGIRLSNGNVVFTAMTNVKVISVDDIFEDVFLK